MNGKKVLFGIILVFKNLLTTKLQYNLLKIYAIDRNYPKLQKFCRYNHQKTPHNNFAKRSLSSGHITGHISQGTPHYPVKGKNDYPISNRE